MFKNQIHNGYDIKKPIKLRFSKVPSAGKMRFGIVVSEWNDNITMAMCKGAVETLINHGALDENIEISYVPGSLS